MINLGYSSLSEHFLIKDFGKFEINISFREIEIDSISCYEDNEIVDFPENLLIKVKKDIESSLN